MTDQDLRDLIIEETGFDMEDPSQVLDSVVPGICRSCHTVVDECEPDATDNWCPDCDQNDVVAVTVLMGVI